MKSRMIRPTVLLLALIYLLVSQLKGQTSYLDTTYEWTEWLQPIDEISYRYKLSTHLSTIDGNYYHEVLRSYSAYGNEWERTENFIRSNPPRIYWHNGSEEKTLYDFSLNVGEEFRYPFGSDERLRVVDIDSITLQNGEKRKLLKLVCIIPVDTSYWVEGLFSLRGLFLKDICYPLHSDYALVSCIHRNDKVLYKLPYFDTCYFTPAIHQPFMDSRYVWTEYYSQTQGSSSYSTRYTFDTVPTQFNGIEYYERLASNFPDGEVWSGTGMYYRGDGNGKIYVLHYDNETLIYDYNLEINDTFFQSGLVVDQIDSFVLDNGEKRKRLTLRCADDDNPPTSFGYTYWLEGLGGDYGVYDTYNYYNECGFDADGYYTLCIFRNDTLLFDHHEFDSCWYLPVATQELPIQKIFLYPNPVSSHLDINDPENIFKGISIISLDGKTLHQSAETRIILSQLAPGIYFAKINLINGNSYVEKLIKQ